MKQNELKFIYLCLGGNLNENIDNDLACKLDKKDYNKIKKLLDHTGKVSSENQVIRNNNVTNFILNYSGEYSVEEIADIFNLHKRTVNNLISDLEKNKGISGKSRKKLFSINSVKENFKKFKDENISLEDVKKFYLICILGFKFKGKVSRKRFSEYFLSSEEVDFFRNDNECDDRTRKNYIDKLLRELIFEERIFEDDKYLSLSINEFTKLDRETIKEIDLYLDFEKYINPKFDTYKRLSYRFKALNNIKKEYIKNENSNFLSIYDERKVLFLEEAILENKYITFKYKPTNKKDFSKKVFVLPLGLIYSSTKDAWYLDGVEGIGKRAEQKLYKLQSLYEVDYTPVLDLLLFAKKSRLKVSITVKRGKNVNVTKPLKIEKINYEKEKDKIFLGCITNDKESININLDSVLDITILKECRYKFDKQSYIDRQSINKGAKNFVRIAFDNESFIERKLYMYSLDRKDCTIKIEENKLVLEDYVVNLDEFKLFVNSFGKSAYILEPLKLRDKCLNDLKLLKERLV